MTASSPPGHPPPPGAAAQWLCERYARRLARRHFAGVHWAAPHDPERWERGVPTLFVANHTNWWDGCLAFLVSRALGLDFQILMEARQLMRYRLFLRVGALPLRREQPRQAYADLVAAAACLRPGAGLWIFPQGERRPPAEPPVRCERGAAHLALHHPGPLRICPVGFRYAFVGEQLPEAFVLMSDGWIPPAGRYGTRAALMDEIERRLAETVDSLDRLVRAERLSAFRRLAEGRLSDNKRLDRFRHALGLMRGPFEVRNG